MPDLTPPAKPAKWSATAYGLTMILPGLYKTAFQARQVASLRFLGWGAVDVQDEHLTVQIIAEGEALL